MDKISFLAGWLVGRRIAGQRQTGGEIPEEWETVLETTVTTAADDSAYGINATLEGFDFYNNPEWIYRVTVGDESIIEVPRYIPGDDYSIGSYYPAYILGNRRLMSAEHEDSGGSFCITELEDGVVILPAVLTTREAGTYAVRIEKMLREPVAYLYNGERLPKIPEVDGYSSACITISAAGAARLILGKNQLDFSVNEGAFYAGWGATSIIVYFCDSTQGWVQDNEVSLAENEAYLVSSETLKWASYDVLAPETYDDVLDGSMPVPVFDYKEW